MTSLDWDLNNPLHVRQKAEYEALQERRRAPKAIDAANGKWPAPKPLPDGLLPVSPFDADFLPAAVSPWAADIADRMQCPLDFVGVPVVVALGSVIGRRIGVRSQRKTDWLEVPDLWGCIVGRPGAMKSQRWPKP